MTSDRIKLVVGLAVVVAVMLSATLPAADEKADDDKPQAEAKDEAKDRYKVPEGGAEELIAFIKEIGALRPATREEYLEYRTKRPTAMKAAAEKLNEVATDEEKKSEGYQEAMIAMLLLRAEEVGQASPEERKALIDDVKKALSSSDEPSTDLASAARQIAIGLEYTRTPEKDLAKQVNQEFGSILSKSENPKTAQTGQSMLGAARRLDLMGKPLEITGTTMDGKPLDWNSYRGKVVLVDFWATWCGPCIGELPNVKQNYEKYHDLGFDVVAISLDADRQKLEEFLEKEQNPWLTLHDGDWSANSLATYYGIVGIPTVILVDKEGKVVSLRARGPELGKQLAALLGPVEESEAADKSQDSEK